MSVISDILQCITDKKEWYNKIYNNTIVDKWYHEIKKIQEKNIYDDFILSINILKTSVQGSDLHLKNCKYKDIQICEECSEHTKDIIIDLIKDNKNTDYDIDNDEYWLEEYMNDNDLEAKDICIHKLCNCVGPDSDLNKFIIYNHSLLSSELRIKLNESINNMMNNTSTDWHPGSNNQVRDIIHPSMYCYVKGESYITVDDKVEIEKCEDETLKYQWLPSQFLINEGKVKLKSYINNLDTNKFSEFVPLVESVLGEFIDPFEKIIKQKLDKFQVIVKVASTHLNNNNQVFNGGSWHIEGMPYEHIIATGLHYVKVEGITDSFLEFRKPVIINEESLEYPQSDEKYTSYHYGLDGHYDGNMNKYLGLIKCDEGASVIFPNTLQHHVKSFNKLNNIDEGTRIIMAFFLIDPNEKIISSADVLQQQPEYNNTHTFTLEEATHHRDRLMYHRKYFVNKLNKKVYERPYSLCEH